MEEPSPLDWNSVPVQGAPLGLPAVETRRRSWGSLPFAQREIENLLNPVLSAARPIDKPSESSLRVSSTSAIPYTRTSILNPARSSYSSVLPLDRAHRPDKRRGFPADALPQLPARGYAKKS